MEIRIIESNCCIASKARIHGMHCVCSFLFSRIIPTSAIAYVRNYAIRWKVKVEIRKRMKREYIK